MLSSSSCLFDNICKDISLNSALCPSIRKVSSFSNSFPLSFDFALLKTKYEMDLPLISLGKISIKSWSLIENGISWFFILFRLSIIYKGQAYCLFTSPIVFFI